MKLTLQKPKVQNFTKSELNPQKSASMWQTLISSLVRPPRQHYNINMLGTKSFYVREQIFSRSDQIVEHKGKKIELSIFTPQYRNNRIILYLHGNSSSRLQSKSLLPFLPLKFSLASFDFMGCGNNEQEDVVTLGARESQQVQTIVDHLINQHFRVCLWGRSMGAVSALMYGKADVIVADSPFRSMKKLCKQLSSTKVSLPKALVECLFPCVFLKLKMDVESRGKYDIQLLDTQKAIKQVHTGITVVFLTGDKDQLVHQRNSQKLYTIFEGKKKHLFIVPGGHNTRRPDEVLIRIMEIIEKSDEQNQTELITRQEITLSL